MRRVRCYECGKRYDFDVDDFCPKCGAFNQPDRTSRIGADGEPGGVVGVAVVGVFLHILQRPIDKGGHLLPGQGAVGAEGSGGGAGGGYTNTMKSIVLAANTPYIIEIGAGGAAPEADNPMTPGKAGGNTSAFSVTANGGAGGNYGYGGGNGGSGGGSYDTDSKKGYAGGSDGIHG